MASKGYPRRGSLREELAGPRIRPAQSRRAVDPTDRPRIPALETGCLQFPASLECRTPAGDLSGEAGRAAISQPRIHSLPSSLLVAPPRAPPPPYPRPRQLTSLPRGPASSQPQSRAPPNPNRPSTLNGFEPESFRSSDWPCWSPSRSSIGSRRPLSQALPLGGGGARGGGLRGSGWLRGGGGSSPRAVLGPELEALLTVARAGRRRGRRSVASGFASRRVCLLCPTRSAA